jgi:nicotinate dehydrogenase subunit B
MWLTQSDYPVDRGRRAMNLPPALRANPRISQWLSIDSEGIVTVRTGKVELGQGILTAMARVAAEELGIPFEGVRVAAASTRQGPNEFITAGSMSVEGSIPAIRQACRHALSLLYLAAAEKLQVAAGDLIVVSGTFSAAGGGSIELSQLASDIDLDVPMTETIDRARDGTTAPALPDRVTRLDLAGKLDGSAAFIQDLSATHEVLHARVIRPRHANDRLTNLSVSGMPADITVIQDGDFIAVAGIDEFATSMAATHLAASATWSPATFTAVDDLQVFLTGNVSASLPVVAGTPVDEPVPAPVTAPTDFATRYTKPFHLHGSIGPSAAMARFDADSGELSIWSHSQGPFMVRAAIAEALAMDAKQISVDHVENAGCYGHNGADDAAMDAAVVARHLPGQHILLKWTRADEHLHEPVSPAMVMDLAATLEGGTVRAWDAEIYSQTHGRRAVPLGAATNLVAGWQRKDGLPQGTAKPGFGRHSGIHRNADPIYDFQHRRIVKHLVGDAGVRTSSTRGLGAFGNVFAIESFMDELARREQADPIAWRLAHLDDQRGRNVLQRLDQLLPEAADYATGNPTDAMGRGIAFAQYKNAQTYLALAVVLSVNLESASVTLRHAQIVADAGIAVDPDGLANQLEGGFIQSASWTLKEQVLHDGRARHAEDWASYPILRFSEIPTVNVDIIAHDLEPSLGAGEAAHGPTPAAIANAIADATDLRLRTMPLSPERLREAAAT